MKIAEFTYTKPNGDVSERALLITQEPEKNVCGIDISELDNDDFAFFTKEMSELHERQAQETATLIAKYDLKHNFRQFVPERMTEVSYEWV